MKTKAGACIVAPEEKKVDLWLEEYRQMHEYMRMHLTTMVRSMSLLLLFLAVSFGVGFVGLSDRIHPLVAPISILMGLYISQVWLVIQLVAKNTARLEEMLRDDKGRKIVRWESDIMSAALYKYLMARGTKVGPMVSPFAAFFVVVTLIILVVIAYAMLSSFRVIEQLGGTGWAIAYVAVISLFVVATVVYVADVFRRGSHVSAYFVDRARARLRNGS